MSLNLFLNPHYVPSYWPDCYLPDGTELPAGYANFDGIIHGWQGIVCARCNGNCQDENGLVCKGCGGTGEAHGPMYLCEE